MTDAVQAGRGLVDYPGLYPNATGTVVANISGVTAIPGPITLAALAAAMGSTSYKGTWNASTNTPTLASSVGTNGYYYVVSVAGTTTLNGIADWTVGDWAIYNGNVSAWQKVEGGATTMTVGTTTVTGGTSGRVLYDNAGVLGEMTNTGTGTVNVLQTSPALITPALGIATATTLALGGATIGLDALAVTGTASISGILTGSAYFVGTTGVYAGATARIAWSGSTTMTAPSNGVMLLTNSTQLWFLRLQFGSTTNLFPAIKRNATALNFRLADDSADAPITAGAATFSEAVSLGNTVNSVSPTSPNRTVTMVIGGTTYYLAAKTTND